MHIDPLVVLAALVVGFIVGLTGMGGGALMTPILVLLFKIQPLAAVSSDLVASMIMKPFGSAVHFRQRTVHMGLVRWLMVGSIPAAFVGVFVIRALGQGAQVQDRMKLLLGGALLLAAGAIVAKALLQARNARRGLGGPANPEIRVNRAATVAIGAVGGLLVGMTSVGSGSLIVAMLLLIYPKFSGPRLVGTDLVQAVPLVAAAALGHFFFGDFKLDLTVSLMIGSIPGVVLGAILSSRAPDIVIRPALFFVLVASALKLLNVGNVELIATLGVLVGLGASWLIVVRVRGRVLRPVPIVARPVTERIPMEGPGA